MPQTDTIVKQEPIGDIGGVSLPPRDLKSPFRGWSAHHLPPPAISSPPPSAFNSRCIRVLSSGTNLVPNGGVGKGQLSPTKKTRSSRNRPPSPDEMPPQQSVDSKEASNFGPEEVYFFNCKRGGKRIGERSVTIGPRISGGTYSEVHKATTSPDGEKYAVKIVNLTKFRKTRSYESILKEVAFLKKFTHSPYIIDLIAKTKAEEHGTKRLYFLLELAETDLGRMLLRRKQAGMPLNLSFVAYWGGQVVEAVKAVHEQNVIHQDLKPANFLVINGGLKLCDFGISKVIPNHANSLLTTDLRGTPMYMAPEVANAEEKVNLSKAYDVWAVGVILYELAYGVIPGGSSNDPKVLSDRARYKFPATNDHGVVINTSLSSVLYCCLQQIPTSRPTINQLANSTFFRNAIGY